MSKRLEMGGPLVSDELRKWFGKKPARGFAFCGAPVEMTKVLDFTGLRGSGSNIYYSFIYQLPKWKYYIRKIDEYIEVTPTWAEYYNLTIAQKQKLEASIKTGLTSAAQAVSDYELLRHDLRRYQEVLDYFKKSHKESDDHILRSLFVDRVDNYTGEGYSMITMAKRWPTMITDFIRMKSEWNDRETIRKELDVTAAEATVLLTKNQLYNEWKQLFFPEVKDRVARLQVLAESRRKSIEEYRSWLKPYVARYKSIREQTELKPNEFMSNPYHTPGFGQAQAVTGVRLWYWKGFSPPEKGKPEGIKGKGAGGNFIIDPYDDFARQYKEKIEKRYDLEITDKKVEELLKSYVAPQTSYYPPMDTSVVYYQFYDADISLSLIRTPPPEGMETDNLMFAPLKAYVMSHNVLLVHLLEIHAREQAFEREVNELIGTSEMEEVRRKKIDEEFMVKTEEKRRRLAAIRAKNMSISKKLKPPLDNFAHLFIKRGPYESVFRERGSKMYSRGIGGDFGTVVGFLLEKMQVK